MHNRVKSQGSSVFASGGGAIAIIGLRRSPYASKSFPTNSTKIIMKGYLLFKQNYAEGMGGGLFAQSVSLDLNPSSCIFEGNSAIARGGALSIQAAKTVILHKCIFLVNKCWASGGAISLRVVEQITFFDVDFINNYAGEDAGALLIDSGKITQTKVGFEGHTLFYGNNAGELGGGLCINHLVLEFRAKALFQSNYAAYFGGGIILHNSTMLFRSDLLMQNNQGNKSGGGIHSNVSTVYFEGNKTEFINSVSRLHGGGLFGFNSSCYFIGETVVFRNNKAFRSGGEISVSGIVLIMNAIEIHFVNNTAQTGGSLQAGQILGSVHSNRVDIRCKKTMLVNNNVATYIGGAFCFYHVQVLLQGEIIGLDNQAREYGGWLYTFECTITISGNMRLEGNSGKAGGTLLGDKSTFVLQAEQMIIIQRECSNSSGRCNIPRPIKPTFIQ